MASDSHLSILRQAAKPLDGTFPDSLISSIGDAHFVLIGEASHGTQEFYQRRADLTRHLIEKQGFTGVVVEADWPDAERVNRFVRGGSPDPDARAALGDFQRFPTWMWRNEVVLNFVGWLEQHNRDAAVPVGFHGMDLYSLHRSMDAVVEYLERVDPEAAHRARQRYSCFEPFGHDPQQYGLAAAYGVEEACETEVVAQLTELQRRQDLPGPDERFYAEQNARLAVDAERYYRSMFLGSEDSWNLRDTHMADTIDALAAHQRAQGLDARLVVWAHNSHLGDARATEASWAQGQIDVGQLIRERHPGDTYLLGQSTYAGEVTAARRWDGTHERRTVRPGLPGSLEAELHGLNLPAFWLDLRRPEMQDVWTEKLLQRFIGVIYAPQTERGSHYLMTHPAQQYDGLLYIDRATALSALDSAVVRSVGDLPDTFPTGQ